eukprot:CAMPEP_0197849796 /NCGR_PEP_ID=MMETSP1438-20131217/13249_1 /TAXON_ID=1461541 /ORGANISM="Pterosperma sp., Strain CCMP1384" /LENGTH=358 /DNA_ID=CAMNT_0043462635 /DNA_START=280 /DNA_END=1356 /DNA_ORIENTATION=-
MSSDTTTTAMSALVAQGVVCTSYGGPEVIKVQQVNIPPPGVDEVRVRIGAAGINPSDTYVVLGPQGPYAGTKLVPPLPFTPGKDAAGVVEAVGAMSATGTPTLSVGDRVYICGSITGTQAEVALCKINQVYPLPDNITLQQGACIGVPCATAYKALVQRGAAKSGETVLVHGASGAVGLAAVQLAVSMGCKVVGTAGTPEGEEAVRQAGANAVVNHKQEGYLQAAKSILTPPGAANEEAGFDLCLEMMASANLANDLTVMKRHGRVAIIGSKAVPIAINPRATMPLELDIRGVFLGNSTPDEITEIHRQLYKAMECGYLKPVVGMELPLEEAAKAHVEVMTPSSGGAAGNIVIKLKGE